MKKTKPKKNKLSKIRRECTYLWGLVIRERDKHTCQWCGKPGNQPHHIISKARGLISRYTVSNGVCLCWRCHIVRLPQEPIEFTEFITKWMKKQNIDYEDLKRRFADTLQLREADYKIIKDNLTYLLNVEKEKKKI